MQTETVQRKRGLPSLEQKIPSVYAAMQLAKMKKIQFSRQLEDIGEWPKYLPHIIDKTEDSREESKEAKISL